MGTTVSPWLYDALRESTLSYPTTFPSLRAHSDASVHVPLFAFDIFEPGPTSRAQAVSRLLDTAQEARVMFKAVLEPVLFRLEADQHACVDVERGRKRCLRANVVAGPVRHRLLPCALA